MASAQQLAGSLTELRHRLHEQPEIGLHLPNTQATVLRELADLGLEISTGRTSSSVTAVLRGAGTGTGTAPNTARRPVMLLRADMDALPIQEEVDVPFRSKVDGAMHACGHDLHTTMLLGAARLLAERREQLSGDVVFMFQPGEEGHDGAAHMIAEGVLNAAGHRAEAAFSLHVMSNLAPRGLVASRPGPLMAACDGLFVTVRGVGGHASSPQLCRDPIPAACEMVLALQTAITRSIDTFTPAVLTVGTLHAGTKRNIIPDTASFEATIRTFDASVRSVIAELTHRVCAGVAAAHGVKVEVRYVEEYPVTVNDPAETAFALDVAGDLFSHAATLQLPQPITGSEDFSRVLSEVPGTMVFLGAVADDSDALGAPSNHSPRAAFADDVLPHGAALFASVAARRLTALAQADPKG